MVNIEMKLSILRSVHLMKISILLCILMVLVSCGNPISEDPMHAGEPTHRDEHSQSQHEKHSSYEQLPELSYFGSHPSDQFLIDFDVISSGSPYMGKRANQPHSGAHIQMENITNAWPKNGVVKAENFPPIYAVADGIVSRVTATYRVGQNDRYGINLAIAREGDAVWEFEYSIEPMVSEPSKDFYLPFILVKEGQKVHKGEIIGYMYLPPNGPGDSHIHFELMKMDSGVQMAVPAIFTADIVNKFYAHWGENGAKDGGAEIPACIGWMLRAEENPFTNQVVDVY